MRRDVRVAGKQLPSPRIDRKDVAGGLDARPVGTSRAALTLAGADTRGEPRAGCRNNLPQGGLPEGTGRKLPANRMSGGARRRVASCAATASSASRATPSCGCCGDRTQRRWGTG